jgi:hypothetical protein
MLLPNMRLPVFRNERYASTDDRATSDE